MTNKINWLHFTDLHYGQKSQNILWPKIKKELFKDIEFIKEEIGKIDIVFFSGDLTQSGKKEEFDELTALLKELWSHLKTLESEPLLVAIPGNHDLCRPDQTKAVVKVLKNYQNDQELKDGFWAGIKEKNENYELIHQCFRNFTDWYNNVEIPKPSLKQGIIPGDISVEILINGIKLKIIGLNTAFLELSSDDYLRRLVISPDQLIALSSNNPLVWAEDADIALLMTHHDPTWYDSQSLAYYNNDINPSNTFYNHLCGHLHEANSSLSGVFGSGQRRIQLAPSLFGLQKINNKIDRIHGYYAGSYEISNDTIVEKFYPRKASISYSGSYKIIADPGFDLNNSSFLEASAQSKKRIERPSGKIDESVEETKSSVLDSDFGTNILDLKKGSQNSRDIDRIPKANCPFLNQHSHIRVLEQKNFIEILQRNQFGWLITDWGLNEMAFIGSITEKLKLDTLKSGFILNCEDIINEDELLQAFQDQFGMPLQSFCNISSDIDNSLLVLDHVSANLYANNGLYTKFMHVIKSIIDFCPKMHVIIIARHIPAFLDSKSYVKIAPLDGSEIRTYIKHHPGSVHELENADNLLKVVEITSGLPTHIDRIIDNLKVVSFEELMEAEKHSESDIVNIDQVPKSLKQTINTLVDFDDKAKARSFLLLKILTVLSNGETIGNLKRFFGTKPVYIENANLLEGLSLIEVITTTRILSKVADKTNLQIKILRVPRQIRDYVNTFITESERDDIIKAGCDLYFGNNWRSGTVKDIYSSPFLNKKFLNVDNCPLIISSMLASAFKNDNTFEIERAANLAVNFCGYLYSHGDYRNAINTSEEVYSWLETTDLNVLKATNAKIYGEALRMIGNNEKANEILKEALEIEGGGFSNGDKNSILTDLGYTYIRMGKLDKAVECVKEIEKTASPKGIVSLQAKYILAQATLAGDRLMQRLKSLEIEAKKINSSVLLNNIMLNIAELESNASNKDKRLNKILESKDDDYNIIRAVIKKSLDSLESGSGEITSDELYRLNLSYSYLYTQRLGSLFKSCHKALWTYCLKQNQYGDLLNLFKHSSLIWRISDELECEKVYFMQLEESIRGQIAQIEKDPNNLSNVAYFSRRKLEFDTNS